MCHMYSRILMLDVQIGIQAARSFVGLITVLIILFSGVTHATNVTLATRTATMPMAGMPIL